MASVSLDLIILSIEFSQKNCGFVGGVNVFLIPSKKRGSSGLSGEAVRIGTGMSRLSSRKLAKPPIGGTFLSRS